MTGEPVPAAALTWSGVTARRMARHALPARAGPIRGADGLHQVFRSWLAYLGHEAFAEHQPDSVSR